MSACADIRVLFRAPAGPRRGFGHLVRCRALARVLGVRPLVAVRGSQHSVDTALRLGCDVVRGSAQRLLGALAPELLVVDDPTTRHAAHWIRAAHERGIAVVSIHDLGLGSLGANGRIDGALAALRRRRRDALAPAMAILDPHRLPPRGSGDLRRGVVVALGGGPRAEAACAIASEIARRAPDVEVRVAGRFVPAEPPESLWRRCPPNVVWVGASTDLLGEFANVNLAVVGGGMSLYEACALGAAAVGLPVVSSQRRTISTFVGAGAALGRPRAAVVPGSIAADDVRLLRQDRLRRQLTRTARRLVDGRSAERAGRVIRRLVDGR
ncbi:MAG: hypothetical protein ACT4QD_06665 [Acidobacteriota bacterium]